jgi:NitT/TauT family transport system substrate-binding protein
VKATLRGLDDILKQGKGVVPDYVAGAPAFKGKEKFVEDVVEHYIEYTYKGQSKLGVMDSARLAQVQKFYVSQGIVPKEVPVNELFTNQFVQ